MAEDPGQLLTEIARSRLSKMFGAVKGQDLIGNGGLIKMIGHSVMVEALLRGAKVG